MTKRLSIYIPIIFLILSCKKSSADQLNNSISEKIPVEESINQATAIKFIEDFYQNNYGTDDLDDSNFTPFLSQRVKNRIDKLRDVDNLILNYDPFIKAQDYDPVIISHTLKVHSISGKGDEYNVSFKLFEEQTEPFTNITIKLIEKDGSYLIDAVKNDQHLSFKTNTIVDKHNIEKTSNHNVLTGVDPTFYGLYHLTQDKGKIDDFSSIVIGYSIKIKKDSVLFSGQGYQTNFYDLCTATQENDTLNIYYTSSIEGTDYNKNINGPLIKLYKIGEKYYAKSSAIWVDAEPNIEVFFEKEE